MLRFEAEDVSSPQEAQPQVQDSAQLRLQDAKEHLQRLASRLQEALLHETNGNVQEARHELSALAAELQQAEPEWDAALRKQRDELACTTNYELGSLLLRQGNPPAAVDSLTAAINSSPVDSTNYMLWYKTGLAYRGLEKWHQAQICFEEALRLSLERHAPSARQLHTCYSHFRQPELQQQLRDRLPHINFEGRGDGGPVSNQCLSEHEGSSSRSNGPHPVEQQLKSSITLNNPAFPSVLSTLEHEQKSRDPHSAVQVDLYLNVFHRVQLVRNSLGSPSSSPMDLTQDNTNCSARSLPSSQQGNPLNEDAGHEGLSSVLSPAVTASQQSQSQLTAAQSPGPLSPDLLDTPTSSQQLLSSRLSLGGTPAAKRPKTGGDMCTEQKAQGGPGVSAPAQSQTAATATATATATAPTTRRQTRSSTRGSVRRSRRLAEAETSASDFDKADDSDFMENRPDPTVKLRRTTSRRNLSTKQRDHMQELKTFLSSQAQAVLAGDDGEGDVASNAGKGRRDTPASTGARDTPRVPQLPRSHQPRPLMLAALLRDNPHFFTFSECVAAVVAAATSIPGRQELLQDVRDDVAAERLAETLQKLLLRNDPDLLARLCETLKQNMPGPLDALVTPPRELQGVADALLAAVELCLHELHQDSNQRPREATARGTGGRQRSRGAGKRDGKQQAEQDTHASQSPTGDGGDSASFSQRMGEVCSALVVLRSWYDCTNLGGEGALAADARADWNARLCWANALRCRVSWKHGHASVTEQSPSPLYTNEELLEEYQAWLLETKDALQNLPNQALQLPHHPRWRRITTFDVDGFLSEVQGFAQAGREFEKGNYQEVCKLLHPLRKHLSGLKEDLWIVLHQLQTAEAHCKLHVDRLQTFTDIFRLYRDFPSLRDKCLESCSAVLDTVCALWCNSDQERLAPIANELQAVTYQLMTKVLSRRRLLVARRDGVHLTAVITGLSLLTLREDEVATLLAWLHKLVLDAGACGEKTDSISRVIWSFSSARFDRLNADLAQQCLLWMDCRFRVNDKGKGKHSGQGDCTPEWTDSIGVVELTRRAVSLGVRNIDKEYHEFGKCMCLDQFAKSEAVAQLKARVELPSTDCEWSDLQAAQEALLRAVSPLSLDAIKHCTSLVLSKTLDPERDRVFEFLLICVICNPSPEGVLEQAKEAMVFSWNEINIPSPDPCFVDLFKLAMYLTSLIFKYHPEAMNHARRIAVTLFYLSLANKSLRRFHDAPLFATRDPSTGAFRRLRFGDKTFVRLAAQRVLEPLPVLSLDAVLDADIPLAKHVPGVPDWGWDDWLLRAQVCEINGETANALKCLALAHKEAGPLLKNPGRYDQETCETHARLFCCLARAVEAKKELQLVKRLAFAFDQTSPTDANLEVPELRLLKDALERKRGGSIDEHGALLLKIAFELNKHPQRIKGYSHLPRLQLAELFLRYGVPQAAHSVLNDLLVSSNKKKLVDIWAWPDSAVDTCLQPPRWYLETCAEVLRLWMKAVSQMLAFDVDPLTGDKVAVRGVVVTTARKLLYLVDPQEKDRDQRFDPHDMKRVLESALALVVESILLGKDDTANKWDGVDAHWSAVVSLLASVPTKKAVTPLVTARIIGIADRVVQRTTSSPRPSPVTCARMCEAVLRILQLQTLPQSIVAALTTHLEVLLRTFAAAVRQALETAVHEGELGSWRKEVVAVVQQHRKRLESTKTFQLLDRLAKIIRQAAPKLSRNASAKGSVSATDKDNGAATREGTTGSQASISRDTAESQLGLNSQAEASQEPTQDAELSRKFAETIEQGLKDYEALEQQLLPSVGGKDSDDEEDGAGDSEDSSDSMDTEEDTDSDKSTSEGSSSE